MKEKSGLEITFIDARDISDAWFQALGEVLDNGYEYVIDRGSYQGQKRKELDYVVLHIKYPGIRPLVPDMGQTGLPPPTSMEYIEQYLEKLITSRKDIHEDYTYGQDLEKQIDEVIRMYKEDGHNTNQAFMAVGNAESLFLGDPQCLRGVDTRIRYGKLHFMLYFRSWDLWAGLPSNLGGLQLVKEYMAKEIGVEDGEIIAASKGLHLYDHCWDLARMRLGRKIENNNE
ncbi:MAG: thymidylate synthase [Candidatus Nanoarchaeia archaeon]